MLNTADCTYADTTLVMLPATQVRVRLLKTSVILPYPNFRTGFRFSIYQYREYDA